MRKWRRKATVALTLLSLTLSWVILPEETALSAHAAKYTDAQDYGELEVENTDPVVLSNMEGGSLSGISSRDTAQDMGTFSMEVGQTITLENPSHSYDMDFHSYNWESSDSSIATASTGSNNRTSVITALKPGTVTIYGFLMGSSRQPNYGQRYNSFTKRWESYTYYTYHSTEHNYKWTVTINRPATSGNTSGNTSGGKNGGSVSAKLTVKKAVKAKKAVTVKKAVKVKKGKTIQLKVTRKGSGEITYKSNNRKVATVSAKGKIKGKKKGTATITVKVNAKGNYKGAVKKIKVTVK